MNQKNRAIIALSILAAFTMIMTSQAALTWTGASDGLTLFDEGNWLDDHGLLPAADTINPGTNITAATGGLIRIDSGTGTPNSVDGGDFTLGIGNHLELGGGKILSANDGAYGIRVDAVDNAPASTVSVSDASMIYFLFYTDLNVTLDGASVMRLKGGQNPLNESTISVLDTDSLIQFENEKYSDFNKEHSSKVTYKGAALEFGAKPFSIEPGDNALATAFNGASGVQIQMLEVDPDAVPKIFSFATDRTSVFAGESVRLSWQILGADAVGIDQDIGVVTGMVSTQVVVNADTTYTLTASNGNGSTTASVHVALSTAPPAIKYFIADKTTVNAGETVTLSWDVLGAETLDIDQGVGNVTDMTSTQVVVNADTIYTFTASNDNGSTNTSVAVSIRPEAISHIPIIIGDATGLTETQGDGGSTVTESGSLLAETGNMWGFTATSFKTGIKYNTLGNLTAGSSLPSTIQAGTYTFEARVGNNGLQPFNGLINLATSDGGAASGMVVGFFETLGDFAANTKGNMYTEFNSLDGVTYTQPTEANPIAGTFTTWIFQWEVAADSPVIGKDFYFGAYIKIPASKGNAWFDDSILSYVPFVAESVGDLMISGPVSDGTEMVLSWTGESGVHYTVETNSNLLVGHWQPFKAGLICDGGPLVITNAIGPDQTFYRVTTE